MIIQSLTSILRVEKDTMTVRLLVFKFLKNNRNNDPEISPLKSFKLYVWKDTRTVRNETYLFSK